MTATQQQTRSGRGREPSSAQKVRAAIVSLRMSGILKVLDGVTTTEEILRVTMAD